MIKNYAFIDSISPLDKSYTLLYQSKIGDSPTEDSKLIKTILGGISKNIEFDSPMLTVTKKMGTYGYSENNGILKPEGKNAFREVAKQGSLNGHLDKHFSDLNRIM